jgi:phenylacetate-CoA ligase
MSQSASALVGTAAAQMIGRFFETLRETRFLPAERMRAYQRGLLESLIRHARTHVPFYRDSGRLDPLFRRGGIDWDRWSEIPFLTRSDVQAAGTLLQSEYLPPEHGPTWSLSTSGTTGQPVTVLHSQFGSFYAWTAQMLRIFEQHDVDPTQRIVRISNHKMEKMGADGTHRASAWFPGFQLLGLSGERVDMLNTRPADELLEAVVAARPRYAHLQPLVLELMCAADREGRLGQLGIEKVFTTGEHLSEGAMAATAEHLGCPVIDTYSSQECGMMAVVCPECGLYHVEAECHLVEVVDGDGKAMEPGKTGSVVVTPLYNYAMPLLRYAHTDRASVAADGDCNVTLPGLTAIFGKEFAPFVFRGGVTIRPTMPVAELVEFLGSASFRVVQIDDERCEILLKPNRLRPDEMRFDELTAVLRKLWWPELKVDYRIVDQLTSPSPGKIKLYERLHSGAPVNGGKIPADALGGLPDESVPMPSATDQYRRFYARLEDTQWLPRSGLDNHRDGLRKRLVEFAHRHSPFYRERLQPLFRRGSEPDLAAWREIPILRRADLENEIDRMNPDQVPAEFGRIMTLRTSGSTGPRLSFRTCMLARVAAECMMYRLYDWHGLDTASAMASIRSYSSGRRGYPDGLTESRWSFVGELGPHHTIDLRHPVADLVEWLVRRAPKYLLTFPSVAYDIAHHPGNGGGGDLALAKIIGISEIVTPGIRTAVRDRLGCEIAQIYACAEMGCIALQSPVDEQCLVCEETVFVELLDDDDRPVGPGETGRVILTSLYNFGTPFIRYEIGDFATLSTEPCPTGRALMRLARIDGRRRNALIAKNRRRVWPHQITVSDLSRMLRSAHFQIYQPAVQAIDLRYVIEDGAGAPDVAGVTAMFSELLGQAVAVSISPIDAIARTAGGKQDLIVSVVDR